MTFPHHLLDGKRGKRREIEIVRAVMGYLAARRVYCWRQNTGAALSLGADGKGRMVRFGLPGLPDILGVLPGGRFVGVEVKRPGEHPTAIQAMRIRALSDAGALAFVATSIADCARELDAAGVKGL